MPSAEQTGRTTKSIDQARGPRPDLHLLRRGRGRVCATRETTRQRAEDRDTAMRTGAVIEQAEVVPMARRRCDAAGDLGLLAAVSQRSLRELREVAAVIVEGVVDPPR